MVYNKNMNREDVINYIEATFDVTGECLWQSFPNYIIFRNKRNKKWFAGIMDVEKSKLGIEGEGKLDILDLKCDPLMIGSLLMNEGYLPAYHMQKSSWIAAVLDDNACNEEIKDLINLSYEIIDLKK